MSSLLNAAYDRMIRRLRDPTTLGQDEKPTGFSGGKPVSLAALFADSLTTGASDTFVVNLVSDRVRLQLLGVHAAIRKYRWENGRLPEHLAELDLKGGLGTDPFSGKPLLYKKVSDSAYELSSIGGPTANAEDSGRPEYGRRVPITLPRTPTPPRP
jgi:hypothetical protein